MNKLKKVIGIVLALVLVSCGAPAEQEQISIGASLFLSQVEFAFIAEAMQQGMDLAVNEINVKGGILGKPVRIIYEDDQLDPARAVTVANKLANVDRVPVALTGVMNTVKASGPVFNEAQIPLIILWDAKIQEVGLENLPYLFGTGFSAVLAGEEMADFAFDKGIRTVAVVSNADDWSDLISRAFVKQFKARGGQILLDDQLELKTADFRTVILKSQTADAIYAPLANNMATFIRQTHELEFTGTLLSADIITPEVIVNAGLASEGLFATQVDEPNTPEMQKLKQLYVQTFGKVTDLAPFVALGYDGVYLVRHAIEKAGKAEPEAIKNALYATHDFDGVMGRIDIDSFGGSSKEERVFVVENGTLVLAQ